MKILLIEPQNDFAKIIGKSLETGDIEVLHAPDAQEGVRVAEQGIDVVVLELALPGHNGLEFLYEFRSYNDWRHIPIIIYSHISSEEAGFNAEIYDRFGVTAHLYKPTTSLQKLENAVRGAVLEPVR